VPVIKKNVESKTLKTISIITATYNASENISQLIKSLQAQTDSEFEWVIADGESNDDTLSIINNAPDLNIKLDSKKDCGIYDALNRGIELSSGSYYLVLGADDFLYPDAIENFRKNLTTHDNKAYDLVSASIMANDKIIRPMSGLGWLYGLGGETSGHSVGLLIKKELHVKYGLYSKKYPICADQKFVLSAIKHGVRINRLNFISGIYGTTGFSSEDMLGSLTEGFRVKVDVGYNLFNQYLLLTCRLIKNILKVSHK
jgi:glycosyltransferase involved in cell wall biosynthesis